MESGRARGWVPLPKHVRWLKERSFSLFVSNLPQGINATKVKAMFWRAGRIVDVFLSRDQVSEKNCGFAFVRFATEAEAERAMEMASGRSWGGRKMLVSKAKYKARAREEEERKAHQHGNINEQSDDITSYDRGVAGWLVDERGEKGVHVASWLIAEEKNTLFCSLVGHLRK